MQLLLVLKKAVYAVGLALGIGMLTACGGDSDSSGQSSSTQASLPNYVLSYIAYSGGSIEGDAFQVVVEGASGSAVTATPQPDYVFASWSDGVEQATRTDTNILADLSVGAYFEYVPPPSSCNATSPVYRLAYTAEAGGRLEGDAIQRIAQEAGGTPVTAVPDPGFAFTNWSDGFGDAERMDGSVSADLSVRAHFTYQPESSSLSQWLLRSHYRDLRVIRESETSARIEWLLAEGQTYNLYLTEDPETDLADYASYGASALMDVVPPVTLADLTVEQPVYVALEIDGVVSAWSSVKPTAMTFNGAVNAEVVADSGNRYLGGDFTHYGLDTGPGIVLPAMGSDSADHLLAGPRIDGVVNAVVADGEGGWFIGGDFTQVDEVARSRLAHIDAAGRVKDWNPGTVNGAVRALALHNGMLYVGGSFTEVGGISRARLAALDTSGQLLEWNPGANGAVHALAVAHDAVYVGGGFTQAGGATRHYLASFGRSGGLLEWNPNPDGSVHALASDQDRLYVGGEFETMAGGDRRYLAAFGADGDLADWTDWNCQRYGIVRTLAAENGVIYVGGDRVPPASLLTRNLAAFDRAGEDLGWEPEIAGSVYALAVHDGVIYIGGDLLAPEHIYAQAPLYHLAAVDQEGNLHAWNPGPIGRVNALGAGRGGIFAGGEFLLTGGESRQNLAAFDSQELLLDWNPGLEVDACLPDWLDPRTSVVNALAIHADVLYVGGRFDRVASERRSNLAAFDLTGELQPWDAFVSKVSVQNCNWEGIPNMSFHMELDAGYVSTLAIDENVIQVTGSFVEAGTLPDQFDIRYDEAAFDLEGNLLSE